jgi:hypothetical protein
LPPPPLWLIWALALLWLLLALVGLAYQLIYWRGLWPTARQLGRLYRLRIEVARDVVASGRLAAMQTNLETQGAIFGVHAIFVLFAVLTLINLPHLPPIWGRVIYLLISVFFNSGLVLLTYRNRRREPEILRLRSSE